MARCCKWAAPTNGAISSWASISVGAWLPAALRPDLAAADHVFGRENGQDGGRRGLAQRRLLSPYDYWQYWRNSEDADVERFLKLFTFLPLDEIARLGALQARRSTRPRDAGDGSHSAGAWARGGRTSRRHGENHLRGRRAVAVAAKVTVSALEVAAGLGVLTAFVKASLVASTGEARRQVKSGGLRVNDAAVTDERATLGDKDFEKDGVVNCRSARRSMCCWSGCRFTAPAPAGGRCRPLRP